MATYSTSSTIDDLITGEGLTSGTVLSLEHYQQNTVMNGTTYGSIVTSSTSSWSYASNTLSFTLFGNSYSVSSTNTINLIDDNGDLIFSIDDGGSPLSTINFIFNTSGELLKIDYTPDTTLGYFLAYDYGSITPNGGSAIPFSYAGTFQSQTKTTSSLTNGATTIVAVSDTVRILDVPGLIDDAGLASSVGAADYADPSTYFDVSALTTGIPLEFCTDGTTIRFGQSGDYAGFDWTGINTSTDTYDAFLNSSNFEVGGKTYNVNFTFIGSGYGFVELLDGGGAPCFTKSCNIMTPRGFKNISKLQKGDIVKTFDGRKIPIKNMLVRQVYLNNISPRIIKAHQFGPNKPIVDTIISKDHAYKNNGKWYLPRLSNPEADINENKITYYNILLNDYENDNLNVNGIEMESWDGLASNDRENRKFKWVKMRDNSVVRKRI